MTPKTIVLYHGNCPDGFGGAYAAWKKFGDTAEYIPLSYGKPIPEGLAGNTLYFIDFCYPQEVMDSIVKEAASVTVLDHHEGVRDVVEKMPEFVFDAKRSGATIAWSYFHPDEPTPELLKYVQDGDLYTFILPHAREVLSYAYTAAFTFEHWDNLRLEIEDETEFARIITVGSAYQHYHSYIVTNAVDHADLVEFEGYTCLLAGASGEIKSDVGNRLARLRPPIALVVSADADKLSVSIRSDGSVDVSALARKYGGNGHPAASGFKIPLSQPMPWKKLEKPNENPSH